jgi:hypothetical protein
LPWPCSASATPPQPSQADMRDPPKLPKSPFPCTDRQDAPGRRRAVPDYVCRRASSKTGGTARYRTPADRYRNAVNRKVHCSSPCSGASFELMRPRLIASAEGLSCREVRPDYGAEGRLARGSASVNPIMIIGMALHDGRSPDRCTGCDLGPIA